ncbi:MAG: hypothetical protein F4X11_22985 [Acidobacteria bacterium]|nr:hypothetical protein [Acidobacteriota bacterium]
MTDPQGSGQPTLPSATELRAMTYEQLIGQIVRDGQWGNSAIAEIHRRSIQASDTQGQRMWWLTLTIAALAVVQIVLAFLPGSSRTDVRIDDLRSDTQTHHAEIRTDVRGLDDRVRAVEVALGKLTDDDPDDGAQGGPEPGAAGH